ncbi:WS/DGAT/MGAT family O-acyltransferase [Nocardia farcinica]|uniref:Diacylglycerol O-acyltransferase n=2 Tax=Nocardia TaxID=1817 RepID=A0A0H5P7G9_NOCFR|nr:wax ester/triacylglycerol synthase family O-acyltransferase [Nocardia farcinica]AXK89520.1 wax ester/triacylglycerol synthase family O-acyltransferase [Nocardia farcinica]MBA4855060.1 wax ester/triacylglycerol synthase family O-acyltransferase [Nocardia farcinica]MBC9815942.1 wax ester/triacylglycerol synthase family O-acyltransferase [Nocardia farcinica]MBF6231398.1 wax ester/triacylglycerol synthase family O-acyltransferase [Nocardia farcinica]MBF6252379.1 wax ester/triacylglycerol syntha
MQWMSPTDSMFLLAESREHPMHVGALQLYSPPPDGDPDYVRSMYEKVCQATEFRPTFRKHPARIFGGFGNIAWTTDDTVDLDYHLRRSALPRPGRVRELLELTSQLHSTLLDRHRPLWEAHLVEGLADGRFAVYTKLHHALMDGVSALRMLQRTLDEDPDSPELRVPWNLPPRESGGRGGDRSWLTGLARDVARTPPATLALARTALAEHEVLLPFSAPKTMLNVRIGGARRCAAQSWPLERIAAIRERTGVTLNDVVLAMCAAALRAYLIENDALPDTPLVAMVPVSLRTEDESDEGGNRVGTILCNLATDLADPAARLTAISESARIGKEQMSALPRPLALAVSALMIAPLGLVGLPGFVTATRPAFNIVISNVPGPRVPMYWQGARLDGNYPLSIVLDGQAVNITVSSRDAYLDFGIVGCRRSVPHLQRLLGHLEDGLTDLEKAA